MQLSLTEKKPKAIIDAACTGVQDFCVGVSGLPGSERERARIIHMSISKVAKLAGVSSSTVSRVINNHPRVAPETAQAVRKAMQALSYTPSERRPGPKPSYRSRNGVANIAFLVLGTSRSRATPAFEDLLRGVSMGA